MQDVLGTFQDSEAQREALYSLATDMMSATAPPPGRSSRWGRSPPGCRRTRTRRAREFAACSSGSRGGRRSIGRPDRAGAGGAGTAVAGAAR